MTRASAVIVTFLAASGCEAQDVVVFATGTGGNSGTDGTGGAVPTATGGASTGGVPEAAPMDAGANTGGCRGDCPLPYFCSKGGCRDREGVCAPRPSLCDTTLQPVCGCDQITYWNDCLRQQYGIPSSTSGACGSGAIRCTVASDCGLRGALCARLLPPMVGCGSSGQGTCTFIPDNCSTASDPLRWVECPPPGGGPPPSGPFCVSTCDAIRAGRLFVPVPPGAPCHP